MSLNNFALWEENILCFISAVAGETWAVSFLPSDSQQV